jgi:hypothetical protein
MNRLLAVPGGGRPGSVLLAQAAPPEWMFCAGKSSQWLLLRGAPVRSCGVPEAMPINTARRSAKSDKPTEL